MSTSQTIVFVCVLVFGDLIVVGALLYAAASSVRSFSRKFPAVEPRADAVRKEFQSFRFGILSLGSSIHVAVDEQHLHLFPAWMARKLGMKAMSIPWSAIEYKGTFLRYAKTRIGGEDVSGPMWAFELAKRD